MLPICSPLLELAACHEMPSRRVWGLFTPKKMTFFSLNPLLKLKGFLGVIAFAPVWRLILTIEVGTT